MSKSSAANSSPPSVSLLNTFYQVCRDSPDRIAVSDTVSKLTYTRLNERATAIADALKGRGVGTGSRIAILLNRTTDYIACLIAVQKVGSAYLPLDPDYPEKRLGFYLHDAAIELVLTNTGIVQTGIVPTTADLIHLDGIDFTAINRTLEFALPTNVQNTDLLYIIYTSGSTGQPKGVGVSYGNLSASTSARYQIYGSEPGRFLLLSSFAFDSSVAGLYWTLTTGGELVLSPPGSEKDLDLLAEMIRN